MKIQVVRENNLYHFVGKANNQVEIHMDAGEDIGGRNLGVRPMTMLLYGLAGCSGIDLISILNKQKQNVEHIKIVIEAQREINKIPSLFTKIHVCFFLQGNLNNIKIKKALDLTFNKYCSVAQILNKSSKISYSFNIIKHFNNNNDI